jgi:5'-nucleotidase
VRRLPAIVVPALLGVVVIALVAAAARPPGPVVIPLLAINDLHGHLGAPGGTNGRVGSVPAGGAAYLSAHLSRLADGLPTLVVAAGDLVGASPLVSGMFHDEPIIEALNAMELSVSAVGNHEFDEGIAELLRLANGGCHPKDGCQDGDEFTGARFQYLAANVVGSKTAAPIFPPTAVRRIGGVTVGFIGLTYQATWQIVPPEVNREVVFLDETAVINRYAAELKRRGVNVVVVLVHEGGRQAGDESASDPSACREFGGSIVGLSEQLTTDVDVVVSGHTHAAYICRVGDRLVTSAGSYGRVVTRIRLTVDPSRARLVQVDADNQIVTRELAPDPRVARIVEKYTALVKGKAGEVVGSVSHDLREAPGPDGRSELGTIIADAQLAAAQRAGDTAAVAFMNAGGVRADIVKAEGAGPGAVTFADLFAVQPFGNTVMAFTITGDVLRQLLEQQFDNPRPEQRRLLYASSGFSYRADPSAPAGQRVDLRSIRLGGNLVLPSDSVRVVTTDFLLGGGDGMSVLGQSSDRMAITTDIDALTDYFRRNSPVGFGAVP